MRLRSCADRRAQKASLAACFGWDNRRRPHQALGWQIPNDAYFVQQETVLRSNLGRVKWICGRFACGEPGACCSKV